MSSDDLKKLKDLEKALKEIERRKFENKLSFYNPYPKQEEFHYLGVRYPERMLFAGNQCGKSYCGAAEVAMHLTGEYPEWWLGHRWDKPIKCWVAGETSEATRDTCQTLLLGSVAEIMEYGPGRGLIPKHAVDKDKMYTARGVGGFYDTVLVKHISGGVSELKFKSYERGREKWQGATLDLVWFDEEPDEEIYIEGQARVSATNGITLMTFTPLKGQSKVVLRFRENPSANMAHVTMTEDDATHLTPEMKKANFDRYPKHQRDARLKGIPFLGSGLVFTSTEEQILVPSFPLPRHWRYIWGVDFGIDHPFAAVLMAWDVDTDTGYIVKCIRMSDMTPLQHAAAMKPCCGGRGAKVPLAWPQDGWVRKEFEGALKPTAMFYKVQGMNILHDHAKFADGSNSTEAGILDMQDRFNTNRLKVFNDQSTWLEEYREYHRDEGKLVKKRDDLMSATRIAVMAKRFAKAVLWAPNTQDGRGPSEQRVMIGLEDDPWG